MGPLPCGDRTLRPLHRGFTPVRSCLIPTIVGVFALLAAAPAFAHHGKDFLLTATDDMPLLGHVYALLSVDDTFEAGATRRSIEITPGILFGLSNRFSLEPHVHIARTEEGNDYKY